MFELLFWANKHQLQFNKFRLRERLLSFVWIVKIVTAPPQIRSLNTLSKRKPLKKIRFEIFSDNFWFIGAHNDATSIVWYFVLPTSVSCICRIFANFELFLLLIDRFVLFELLRRLSHINLSIIDDGNSIFFVLFIQF